MNSFTSRGLTAVPFVRLSPSAAQLAIPSGALTRVTFWDTEDSDALGFHEGVTNPSRITVPAGCDGLYLVESNIWWANQVLGTVTVLQARLYKNGNATAERSGGFNRQAPNSGGFATYGQDVKLAHLIRLVATDYLEIFVFHDKTAAGTLDLGALESNFSAVRIGL